MEIECMNVSILNTKIDESSPFSNILGDNSKKKKIVKSILSVNDKLPLTRVHLTKERILTLSEQRITDPSAFILVPMLEQKNSFLSRTPDRVRHVEKGTGEQLFPSKVATKTNKKGRGKHNSGQNKPTICNKLLGCRA